MKKGYKIIHSVMGFNINFLIVSNYIPVNEIFIYGFSTIEEVDSNKYDFDIGVWRIKYK